MKNNYLNILTRIVLPAQILDYFHISEVEQDFKDIFVDKKINPELSKDAHFDSKDVMKAVNATDFPTRNHKVQQ